MSLNGKPQFLDEGEITSLPDTAANGASTYAALRDDITLGTSSAPNFDHAVHLTQLIADVTTSSETGTHMSANKSLK